MNECDHYYKDISNHWFHWNTGEVMCIGRCSKCGIRETIPYSIIKNQKTLQELINKVNKIWKEDPEKAIAERLIMTIIRFNDKTKRYKEIAVKDNAGNIMPLDNRKYLKNSDGTKYKNYNYKKPIKFDVI